LGYAKFKSLIYRLIKLLPETNIPIGEWINEVNKNFVQNNIHDQLIINRKGDKLSFEEVFFNEDYGHSYNCRVGTIHSVKGETFDAALIILRTKGIGKTYKTLLLDNTPIIDSEELRIAYVGLTRPRKLLIMGVPNSESKNLWAKKFQNDPRSA
jgi:superfamily I DNA/RNA helicase